MEELTGRYQKRAWSSQRHLQEGKRVKTASEVRQQLGLDGSRKTAVIFPHVLWDGTFLYGESLFDDYEQWLVETIKVACRNSAVRWVIKLHPDYLFRWKMKYGGSPRELMALDAAVGELPPHVDVLGPDTDISTFSLFQVADYALTVRGTIGLEMPCFGVPVFTAGTGRYSGLGFTIDSGSREEYFARIARIQDFPRLTEEQTLLAKKHAYALFRLRPWVFHSFQVEQRPSSRYSHPLEQNVVLGVSSLEDLRQASDMRAIGQWAARGAGADFLVQAPEPDSPAEAELASVSSGRTSA